MIIACTVTYNFIDHHLNFSFQISVLEADDGGTVTTVIVLSLKLFNKF